MNSPKNLEWHTCLNICSLKAQSAFQKQATLPGRLKNAGGEINAYTTFDHTVFYINAPREFAFQGAELLFDVVCSSLLDSEELSRELEVVIEEIRRSRDNPSARLSHTLFGKLFSDHPKGRPVIGYEEVVKTFNRDNLRAFYKRWYIPNNMFFIAAGDFHLGEMNAKLDSLATQFPQQFARTALVETSSMAHEQRGRVRSHPRTIPRNPFAACCTSTLPRRRLNSIVGNVRKYSWPRRLL